MVPTVAPLPERYTRRRAWLAEYFDRTASRAWAAMTSDAPVSRIRRTVREGRERMGATLLGWLPADLEGKRVLDAGCGPGVLSIALAARGATVVAVDLADSLLEVARTRIAHQTLRGTLDFRSGDMLDPAHGTFDYVVAMDSLIHYQSPDMLHALTEFAGRTRHAMVITYAPRTPLLSMMHVVGRAFPRRDRAPAIEPVGEGALRAAIAAAPGLSGWRMERTQRVQSAFYTSQALELRREGTPAPAGPSARHATIPAR